MSDEKYVVLKRNDLLDWMKFTGLNVMPDEVVVKDAVVIRRQDVFAPPALDAYANSIMAAVEVMKTNGINGPEAARLMAIADYFHNQALLSWDTVRKLPD